MKKTDQDVLDLNSLKHSTYNSIVESQRDKAPFKERTTNSILHEYEEDSPYQTAEKQVVENDVTKTPNNDISHTENSPLNPKKDRAHNTQPKVSFILNSI